MIHLIIPMSGIGKRFIDAGYDTPKPLIMVDGKPIIEHVVELFPNVGKVSFICNDQHLLETNMRSILKSIVSDCEIYEVPVGQKGPVDSVLQICDNIDDESEVIISYCDYGSVWDFEGFLKDARGRDADGSIACYTGFHPHMLGSDNYAFCKETNMLLEEIKEKEPFTSNKMNEYASNGTYYFKRGSYVKTYFKELVKKGIDLNGEFYVSLVYNLLVNDGLKVSIFEIEKMLQWGTPYDLEIYKGWSNYFNKKELMVGNNPKGTTLVLPMAGKGSRFTKEGYGVKPILEVDGKPMIIKAVDCLPKCENNIFITLNDHIENFGVDNVLTDYYDNTQILGIDGVTEGQACTCELGLKHFNIDLEKPILISACDNGVYYDSDKYQKMVDDESIDIIVWSFRNNQTSKVNPNAYAWLDVDGEGNIKHVSCKKFIYDDPLTTHAIIGTMFFRKGEYFMGGLEKNYEEDIRTNGEFYVDDVLNQNIKDGLNVKVFEVENYICWGTPDDYQTYNYWLDYFTKKIKT